MVKHIGTLIRTFDITEPRLAFYQQIGLDILQIAGVNEDYLVPTVEAVQKSDDLFALFRKYGFTVPTMFLSFPEQDWTRCDETVGLVPEAFRAGRMVLACRQMLWGKKYGIKYIACHVGTIPENGTEAYCRFVNDLRQLAAFANVNGQQFIFETGMESAAGMKTIIRELSPADTGINFDPANLLIYDQTAPDEFLDELIDKVQVVHCKDAVRPTGGSAMGRETPLGQGDTGFAQLLKRLLANGFAGPLIIERELPPGPEQERDISKAVTLIKNICEGVK